MTEPAQSDGQVADAAPSRPGRFSGPTWPGSTIANCAACHGVDGTGKLIRAGMPTIPDFTSLAWQMSQTDLEITHRIRGGQRAADAGLPRPALTTADFGAGRLRTSFCRWARWNRPRLARLSLRYRPRHRRRTCRPRRYTEPTAWPVTMPTAAAAWPARRCRSYPISWTRNGKTPTTPRPQAIDPRWQGQVHAADEG